MDKIKVISSDLDGAQLRRAKTFNSRFLRCDGTADDAEINEAVASLGTQHWGISSTDWERIFGGKVSNA